ncbi:MAG: SMC-Scp complex subunit ScpB [Ruminococcus sp.]|nr:SMC-Scp complex subunit ScpB [Ruminococcus sp.]
MSDINIAAAIEAILFANGASVEVSRIAEALAVSDDEVIRHAEALTEEYKSADRGITIIRLDQAFQMVSNKMYASQIRTVMDLRRNTPLSQAALEVLAVVAYNQPVTKAFVEQVRGVDCSGVLGSLTAKNLIEEKGRLELPGRPLLYGTTENFLLCFNLQSLDDLPPLPEDDKTDDLETETETSDKTDAPETETAME